MASSDMATGGGSDFDPYTQTITLLAPDSTPVEISLPEIDEYVKYGIRISINYSSQIGASIVLLVVLLLLTRKEKRSSAMFYLNAFALASNAIRNLLQCIYFTGPFYDFYTYFGGDYSMIPRSQVGASVAGIVLGFIVLVCVEASLVLQIKAVCVTMREMHKFILTIVSAIIGLTAIGFRFGMMVQNARAVVNIDDFIDYQWLAATNNYVTTGSICFFSLVFVTKLGVALNARRKMQLKQFGPMEVIFIMGCQTLFIPAIFSILQNFTTVPELGSQVLTLTALFLPLSSIWAAASIANNKPLDAASSAPSYTMASSGTASSTNYKDKSRKGSRSSFASRNKGGLLKGLGFFASERVGAEKLPLTPSELENGSGQGHGTLPSSGAGSATAAQQKSSPSRVAICSSPEGQRTDGSSAYKGDASSRFEVAGATPVVGLEKSNANAKRGSYFGNGGVGGGVDGDGDAELEKDLKIHMGKSFGV